MKPSSHTSFLITTYLTASTLNCTKYNLAVERPVREANCPPTATNDMRDLVFTRTEAQEFCTNATLVASKAYHSLSALLRSLGSQDNKVLWAAFTAYVLSVLNYASMSRKPYLRRDVNPVENIQRRYSNRMWGLREWPRAERLSCLSALSLERSRDLADLLHAYKIFHDLVSLSMGEAGISLQKDVTRGSDRRLLVLLARTEKVKSHFKYKIATLWNN